MDHSQNQIAKAHSSGSGHGFLCAVIAFATAAVVCIQYCQADPSSKPKNSSASLNTSLPISANAPPAPLSQSTIRQARSLPESELPSAQSASNSKPSELHQVWSFDTSTAVDNSTVMNGVYTAPLIGLGRQNIERRSISSAVATAAYTQSQDLPDVVEPPPYPEEVPAAPQRERRLDNSLPVLDSSSIPPEVRGGDSIELQFPVPDDISLALNGESITLSAQNASLSEILTLLAKQMNLNLVCSEVGEERINVKLTGVSLSNALDSILPLHGYTHVVQNNIVIVSKIDSKNPISATLQGKQIRVFDLNYVSAVNVLPTVTKFLSPIGSAYINSATPENKLQTHEQLIVEDMVPYLAQVENYIGQIDTPPRQVQVEAHVLQVTLQDNCRHGVDFDQLLRVANSDLHLQTVGLATTTGPRTVFRIDGTDLTSIVDLLKSTTDAKTLASPKVTVLNGQKSRMQVGGKIGYLMTTTTQTSTLQTVDFLEYGVILTVTPSITVDEDIIMHVKPQVSTGRVNATTNLPESETTEVETTVMLKSGEALILGGLIKETDTESQNKLPVLGDLWLIGRVFQRRSHLRERNEVIITLLPKIVNECTPIEPEDIHKLDQSTTPLLYGPLEQTDRTHWEPELPDSTQRRGLWSTN